MKTLTHWMDIPRMLHHMDDKRKDKAMVHHRLLGSPLNPYRLPENEEWKRISTLLWLGCPSPLWDPKESLAQCSCRWGSVHAQPLSLFWGPGKGQQPWHWRSRSINNSQIYFYVSTTLKLMFYYLHILDSYMCLSLCESVRSTHRVQNIL